MLKLYLQILNLWLVITHLKEDDTVISTTEISPNEFIMDVSAHNNEKSDIIRVHSLNADSVNSVFLKNDPTQNIIAPKTNIIYSNIFKLKNSLFFIKICCL